jgi:hypothetical protein
MKIMNSNEQESVLGISLLSEVVASNSYSPSFLAMGWKDF